MRIPVELLSTHPVHRLTVLAFSFTLALPGALRAQVKCSLGRQPSSTYVGFCIGQREVPVRVELEPSASASGLWRGKTSDTTGYRALVALDTVGRVYRDVRGWFRLVSLTYGRDSLWYEFSLDSLVTPTEADLQVLQRARTYLADSSHWSHADDGDIAKVAILFFENPDLARGGYCATGSRRTLVCELYHASIEVTGEYWWGSPTMNAIRAAVTAEDAPGLRHPLMQFNGSPTTTLRDVQRVIDVAIGYVKERRSCNVQYWVWGERPCRQR